MRNVSFMAGDEVRLLANGFGSTTRMELLICMRRTLERSAELIVSVRDAQSRNDATCQEAAEVSLSLPDGELHKKTMTILSDSPRSTRGDR